MAHTDKAKHKISLSKLGKPRSDAARQKISDGMKQSHANSELLKCPHCGFTGKKSTGNLTRFHFDNCKKSRSLAEIIKSMNTKEPTVSLQDFIAYRKDLYENVPDADLIAEATQDYLDHDPKYLAELQDEYDRLSEGTNFYQAYDEQRRLRAEIERVSFIQRDD